MSESDNPPGSGREPSDLGVDDDHAQYTSDRSPFGRPPREPMLARTFPVSRQILEYRQRKLRADLVAGMTVAAIAIPAALVGVSPVAPGSTRCCSPWSRPCWGSSRWASPMAY